MRLYDCAVQIKPKGCPEQDIIFWRVDVTIPMQEMDQQLGSDTVKMNVHFEIKSDETKKPWMNIGFIGQETQIL